MPKFSNNYDFLLSKSTAPRLPLSKGRYCIGFLNPFSYERLLGLEEDLSVNFDAFYADGKLLRAVHNAKYGDNIERVSFDYSSIAEDVFKYADSYSLSVALVGGTDEELSRFRDHLQFSYKDLTISTMLNGFNSLKNIEQELEVRDFDILIVGMGTPLQELLISRVVRNVNIDFKLAFTCGGFMTQTIRSKGGDYYNPLIKRFGLFWLQRAYHDVHVRRRLLFDYPKFIFKYLFDCYKK